MTWYGKQSFYISTNAKNIDKDLTSEIVKNLKERSIQEVFHLKNYEDDLLSLPDIYVFSSDESHIYSSFTQENLVLVIPSFNTNMFSSQDDSTPFVLQVSDVSDWLRIERELFELIDILVQKKKDQIEHKSFQNLKSAFKIAKNEKEFSQKKMKSFETMISQANNLEELCDILPILGNEVFDCKLAVRESSQIKTLEMDEIFPLGIDTQDFYLYTSRENAHVASLLYSYLNFVKPRFNYLNNGHSELVDASYLLQKIPFPIALIDKNDELLLHNEKFLNLNISVKKCLEFKENEQVEINKNPYKVNRKFIGNDTRSSLIYFYPLEDLLIDELTPTNEEMGIVSSSIAHELNNPLAGILAAIEVICLDEISPSIQDQLNDMKDGVLRCKELVETFLGFSRAMPHQNFKGINTYNSFKQAIELLRFRLVENQINLILNHEIEDRFDKDINPHVLVMIFYLLVGDLLTNYTHRALITNEKNSSIVIEFVEKEGAFFLKTPSDFGLDNNFIASKLLKHLMETQRIKLSFSSEQINFTYK